MRSSSTLIKQEPLLDSLRLPSSSYLFVAKDNVSRIIDIASHYEEKLQQSGTHLNEAKDVLKLIANEIEGHGLHGARDTPVPIPP